MITTDLAGRIVRGEVHSVVTQCKNQLQDEKFMELNHPLHKIAGVCCNAYARHNINWSYVEFKETVFEDRRLLVNILGHSPLTFEESS